MAANDSPENIDARLAELRMEHRDLDTAIAQLLQSPSGDELLLRRMKKRKLGLKDRIARLERMIDPDVPA